MFRFIGEMLFSGGTSNVVCTISFSLNLTTYESVVSSQKEKVLDSVPSSPNRGQLFAMPAWQELDTQGVFAPT